MKPFLRFASAVAPEWALPPAKSTSTSAPIHELVLTIIAVFLRLSSAVNQEVLVQLSIFRSRRTGKSRRQNSQTDKARVDCTKAKLYEVSTNRLESCGFFRSDCNNGRVLGGE